MIQHKLIMKTMMAKRMKMMMFLCLLMEMMMKIQNRWTTILLRNFFKKSSRESFSIIKKSQILMINMMRMKNSTTLQERLQMKMQKNRLKNLKKIKGIRWIFFPKKQLLDSLMYRQHNKMRDMHQNKRKPSRFLSRNIKNLRKILRS